jgi:hypothetical protein
MINLLLSVVAINSLSYALPLIVVVSLVYSATRHEQMRPILLHSLRTGTWIVAFMIIVFVVLELIAW